MNRDGVLQRKEFADLIHHCGFDFDEAETARLIQIADRNGDGALGHAGGIGAARVRS